MFLMSLLFLLFLLCLLLRFSFLRLTLDLSLYSSASLSSRPPPCAASSASASLYRPTSSFTPLFSSTSASSFALPPLSYPPRPSVLSPAVGVLAPPPPGFPPVPLGFPPHSSSLVSSSFSTPFLFVLLPVFFFPSLFFYSCFGSGLFRSFRLLFLFFIGLRFV